MDETTFLRLLLDEAPAAAFEDEVRRGRERGLAPAEQERLQEAGYLAMQLRLVLRERRRREAELAALFATAGDLTAIRDPQRVLQAIARRARQLLEADTAYLTLIDEERGDTYMRVTEGTLTPEFDQVRLPLGVGLGGLVAETAMPYYTSDYLADERFAHAGDIDEAVSGEDLRAILGVPLILSETVIGVLFVSNRHTRPFSAEEVNLLQSLAAHAAIVIENARLFEQTQQALDELSRTNAVVRAHSEAVERAAAAHERLTNIVLQGGTLEQVAAAVGEVLEGEVAVLDPSGVLLAGSAPAEVADHLAPTLRGGTRHTGGEAGHWLTPVGAGGDDLGVLVLRSGPDLGDADRRTLERAAQVTALVLLSQRAVADAELRLRGELLDDLLVAADRDLDVTRRRARRLGVDVDAGQLVLVASAPDVERAQLHTAAAGIVDRHGGLLGERDDTVVVLVPDTGAADPRVLGARLSMSLGATVTVGAARAGSAPEIADAFREADRCRRTLFALGRAGEVATNADLGIFSLLLHHVDHGDLGRFVDDTLGPVIAYDEARGTELLRTLEAWFANGGNLTHAAADLHVHVNTLYQRCDRISSLLGTDWQSPQEALRLHLALEIRRLQHAT